jgi:carboxylesterase
MSAPAPSGDASVALAHAIEPFNADGGPTGVLLCHGFSGSPASLRPWAQALAEAGLTVRLPRLPGHGSTVEAANRVGWTDWFDCVDREFTRLAARCEQVFVFGLSMGGGLALRLAEVHHGGIAGANGGGRTGRAPAGTVAGLVLVNPSVVITNRRVLLLPLLRRISASSPGISNDISMGGQDEAALTRVPHEAFASMLAMNKLIRRDLAKISAPILLYRSVNDHVVGPQSAALIKAEVRGPYERRDLPRSFHVATLDHEADDIIDGSLAFVRSHTTATTGPGTEGRRR